MTNGMDADKLRKVKESYQYIKHVRQKAESLLKKISSLGKLDDSVTSGICNARSLVELESIVSTIMNDGINKDNHLNQYPFYGNQTLFIWINIWFC